MARGTEAQQKAHDRSWYIVRLRSLYVMVGFIRDPLRRQTIQDEIDRELVSLKAQPQRERNEIRRRMMREGDYEGLDLFEKKHGFKGIPRYLPKP